MTPLLMMMEFYFDPPLQGKEVSLSDCLEAYVKVETLDGDEKPTCDRCKDRRKCLKWYSIEKWPSILVVHLKRFAPVGSYRAKLSGVVDTPVKNFDVRYSATPMTSSPVCNLSYFEVGYIHTAK